jgi:hypothetical protein
VVSALSAGAYTTTFLVMVDRVKGGGRAPPTLTRVQIQKEEISDLKRENQFLVKSALCKPVLKLNFTAHAIMESLSEF